ncbi:hypothetical protein HII31_02733 [Pseudocercospora fuligena]|uniref:Uncharacterized protein n=1 Tax=Pseudocercospora fuligena TaxID=685502 RepID=A0A8H6RRT1_9PEZI|nr:hypothetical protein HII31_02733 [Pseudocercospora fuligena]
MPGVQTKAQPWKAVFPQKEGDKEIKAEATPEQINLQRSYGTHAPNSKGKLIDVKVDGMVLPVIASRTHSLIYYD